MISQLFILSARGDIIITRDYLGNIPKGASEVFLRKVKFWDKDGSDAPPVFCVDGVSYLHTKEGGLYFLVTTRENVSPSLVLELLRRIGGIIKDYVGVLSEEGVRRNCVLLYELLDEVIDYGFPQNSSSAALKEFVLNEPTAVKPSKAARGAAGVGRGPTGVIKSILDTARTDGKGRDEIFVDIVEKVSCTFSAAGHLQNPQIDGAIQVKSYLTGNPAIAIALSDKLTIGRREGSPLGDAYGGGTGYTQLDDCNFHQSVSLERFETERVLDLVPPDGEFAVMNYRSTAPFRPPFRVTASVEDDPRSTQKAVITVRLRAEFGKDRTASGVELSMPMGREVQRVAADYAARDAAAASAQSWDWADRARRLTWKLKRVAGGSEHTLTIRATLESPIGAACRQGMGPLSLQFTIPMYCTSRLQVRFLQIMKQDKSYQPYRWVRYVTMSNSYVVRM